MKKTEEIVSKNLIDMLEEKYNLVITEENATKIARRMLKHLNLEVYKEVEIDQALWVSLYKYYSTTPIEKKEFRNHSAFWFAMFLHKNGYTVKRPFWKTLINKFK